ncbi:MAG: xanthine dehydrogenase large subunit [Verrucomicrobiota bacterium]
MTDTFEFLLNGRAVTVRNVSPNSTLLEFLRARRLTGSKEGCAEGDCGACSVAIFERDAAGLPAWRVINSCLLPIACLAGREVISVEGVAGTELHPVQRCMVARHGSQCGYCTPGIIMSMFEAWHRSDMSRAGEIEDQLQGNLCRCTGYRPIRDAMLDAAIESARDGAPRTSPGATPSTPFPMEYEVEGEKFFRPADLGGLREILKRHPEARLLAGGTEIGLDLTKRYKKFPALISLEGIGELTSIDAQDGGWRIGAAVPLTAIDDRLGDEIPAVRQMIRLFGSRQIRHRATLGGNLATASPIGDAAPLLLALDAQLELASHENRLIPIETFFTGYRKTCLVPGEIISAVWLPRRALPARHLEWIAFHKVSKRREMDISTVSGAFRIQLNEKGVVCEARLAFGGVAPTTVRARRSEELLIDQPWNERMLPTIVDCLAREFEPISDVRGSAEFRRGVVTALFEKFFHEHSGSIETGLDVPARPAGRRVCEPTGPVPVCDAPHESGHLHVTGEALYVDDFTAGQAMLEVWPVCSSHAHARILSRDVEVARRMPGIRTVLLGEDVPGLNDVGPVKHDEPMLAVDEVLFHGQVIALVVGDSLEACRLAAEKVVIQYEPLAAILRIDQAIAAHSFHNEPNYIRRGDADSALRTAPQRIEGEFSFGGQDHFYLETQAAFAVPGEDGSMRVASSTQHPGEVQVIVAHVLDIPVNRVVVEVPRVGGGFGGKETQAAAPAAWAALAARKTGRAVRVRLNRDQDMILTGKRHPFLATFDAGFDSEGVLSAVKASLYSDGGWSLDLSQAVTDRALFHLDNAYYIPHAEFRGQVAKIHLASNTAFRGFGGPQGMLVIEEILDRIARHLRLPPEIVRERNLYRGTGASNTTPYGQEIGDTRLQTIWHELKRTSRFDERRVELAEWNVAHSHRKRGLAITPVKFGISFTVTHLNQAGALVLLYQDGSAQVNHGGIEMGQGIHTNIRSIASRELGVSLAHIRVMPTSTDKVPNTSATAASAGTDLNGAAVQNACETLVSRLKPTAAKLLAAKLGSEPQPADISFAEDFAFAKMQPTIRVPFADVVRQAYLERVSLAATGYYRTPGISWDRATGRGRPFHYFANGAAVTEVEVDGFTGAMHVLRVDILQDTGDSINAAVNRGQIEGGFIQGMGWLTAEELKWDEQGRLLTHSPDTYKIPAFGDAPREFNVSFLERAAQADVIHGSKAVGEPPLMLAISVREAIRDAVAAFAPLPGQTPLASPATGEAIFMAIRRQRARDGKSGETGKELR